MPRGCAGITSRLASGCATGGSALPRPARSAAWGVRCCGRGGSGFLPIHTHHVHGAAFTQSVGAFHHDAVARLQPFNHARPGAIYPARGNALYAHGIVGIHHIDEAAYGAHLYSGSGQGQ